MHPYLDEATQDYIIAAVREALAIGERLRSRSIKLKDAIRDAEIKADLAAARAAGRGPVVVDTRSLPAWQQGHLPGAVHIPGADLTSRAAAALPDRDVDIVVYCWGPGCNGATKAAHALAELGYSRVRELIGGFEYWAREGFAIQTDQGRTRRPLDPLTGVPPAAIDTDEDSRTPV